MKIIISISWILLVFISCKQVKDTSINEKEDEIYKRKMIELGIQFSKVFEYQYAFGKPDEKTAFLVELIEYDKNGNPIRRETYNKSEYLKKYNVIREFFYDSDNNPSETKEYDTSGNLQAIVKNKYENKNNTERLFYSMDGELESKVIYEYDKSGNNIELISYEKDGSVDYKTFYKYNKTDEVIEEKSYDKNGKIKYTTRLIKHDEHKTEYDRFDEKNELEYKTISILNDKNQLLENEFHYMKDSTITKTTYKYDANDLLVEIITYENHGEPSTIKKIERIKFK